MIERRSPDAFETRVAGLVSTYTDVATARRIDSLAVSRLAMSSRPATRWSPARLGVGQLGRPIAGDRWVAAAVAALLVAVVGLAVQGRLSESRVGQPSAPAPSLTSGAPSSVDGSIPDALRHAWQRPFPVAPGPDVYGSGFLSLTGTVAEFGREPGAGASQALIEIAGPDTLMVTATAESPGCQPGDVATYRWTVEGSGTALTLTSLVADPCPAREALLAGPWVRADLPPRPGGGSTLAPGSHTTSAFDPFVDPARTGRLVFIVPAGWEVVSDEPESLVLHSRPDVTQGLPSRDLFLAVLRDPAMAAEFKAGAACDTVLDAPGVGRGRDELLAAIRARPSLVSTPPAEVTVGSRTGLMLDVRLTPSWTGGCVSPAGPIVGAPILHGAGTPGPVVGVNPDVPVRVVFVDLAAGHTLAVVIFGTTPSPSASFETQASVAMPIVSSFDLRPSTP